LWNAAHAPSIACFDVSKWEKDASLRGSNGGRSLTLVRHSRRNIGEVRMAWKAPKIVEVPVGMEINMYACAARK
jgi:coenzyme PQQ precursor peptide PqqA